MGNYNVDNENKVQEICSRAIHKFRSSVNTQYIANLSHQLIEEGYTAAMVEDLMREAPKRFDQYPSLAQCLDLGREIELKKKHARTSSAPIIKPLGRRSPWPMMVEVLMRQRTGELSGRGQNFLRHMLRFSDSEIDDLEMCYRAKDWRNPGAVEILKKIPSEEAGDVLEKIVNKIQQNVMTRERSQRPYDD